jgi:hypothetical protein
MLVASYEAIRFQRLDLFTVTLRQIGAYIARSQFKDAVDVLINGDGNNNPAAEISPVASGSISYEDLIALWNSCSPYEMNTLIASPDVTAKLLSMPEFRDAPAGLNFHGTGNMITPMGAEVVTLNSLPMANGFIGLDNTCALEKVQVGDVATDFDKLIDRQLERATITTIAGFSRIFDGAIKAIGVVE